MAAHHAMSKRCAQGGANRQGSRDSRFLERELLRQLSYLLELPSNSGSRQRANLSFNENAEDGNTKTGCLRKESGA